MRFLASICWNIWPCPIFGLNSHIPWILIYLGLDNGLVLKNDKPLSYPMISQFTNAYAFSGLRICWNIWPCPIFGLNSHIPWHQGRGMQNSPFSCWEFPLTRICSGPNTHYMIIYTVQNPQKMQKRFITTLIQYNHRTGFTLVQVMACAWSAPSHYPSQCWFIVSWTISNKLQWNLNKYAEFFKKIASENAVLKKSAILCSVFRILKLRIIQLKTQ